MHPLRLLAVSLCLGLGTLPLLAQAPPSTTDLPISHIVLFSSGVGYFQREGDVDGNAHVDLQFSATDVNDLLKSLVLQDTGGGHIGTVTYDNRNPLAMTLKSFALDLTANPSLADLLNQARGEQVEILANSSAPGSSASTPTVESQTGVIVGVERQRQPLGKDQVIEVDQLNLLTEDGLQGIALRNVTRIKFTKEPLNREFRKALAVLATGHDKQKKTVSLNFTGQGKRRVRVAYVTQSPVWKTSYRLDLKKDKAMLQGWAVVENTTDEDWRHVRMGLISGRPMSFQMDLYEPLFANRPVVEPELFAGLRPQMYGGNLDKDQERFARESIGSGSGSGSSSGAGIGGRMMPQMKAADTLRRSRQMAAPAPPGGFVSGLTDFNGSITALQGVTNAATAAELGDYFQYAITEPVTLARQKSALLPIVGQDVRTSHFSIYNEAVLNKHPLLGLRLVNNTPLHFSQGPITVYEGGTYAGDARIPDMQPAESRLLSYAIDLGTEVEPRQQAIDHLMLVKVVRGILQATYRLRETKTYTIKNRSEHVRHVLVEHPLRPSYHLVQPTKPAERSRDLYRFEIAAEPGKPAKLEVVEELPRMEILTLTNLDTDAVRFYIRTSASSPTVKQALQKALELKSQVDVTRRRIDKEQQALKVIEEDQARMRANMARVPQTSDAYKRYLKKFDDQETEIEKRRAHIVQLEETAESQRKAYEEYLAALTVD